MTCQLEVAGAMLTPESIESPNADKKMIGSVFICEADSLADVRKLIETDVYYTNGVVSTRFRMCCGVCGANN